MNRGAKRPSGKIIFVTGTDTGVGKTMLATLLIYHLRQEGLHALGMKPFACGSHDDARLLQAAQESELTIQEINPFYFREPVAPLVAARMHHRKIRLNVVLKRIRAIQKKCEYLVIEGCGGLSVPLGEGYTVADLIAHLKCRVLVASRNRLGTLNHTLLTLQAMQHLTVQQVSVAVITGEKEDFSSATNVKIIRELTGNRVERIPFLCIQTTSFQSFENNYQKVKKTLARLCG